MNSKWCFRYLSFNKLVAMIFIGLLLINFMPLDKAFATNSNVIIDCNQTIRDINYDLAGVSLEAVNIAIIMMV